jgi:hypothetical protein
MACNVVKRVSESNLAKVRLLTLCSTVRRQEPLPAAGLRIITCFQTGSAGLRRTICCPTAPQADLSRARFPWPQVRNIDGFTKSIMRRIQEEGLDIGTGDIRELSRPVEDAILRHVDDGAVSHADFANLQVVQALKSMSDALAIDVRTSPASLKRILWM